MSTASEFNSVNRNELGGYAFAYIIKLLASMSKSIHRQLVIRKEKGSRDWVACDHHRATIIRAGDAKRDASTSTRLCLTL